MALTQQDLDSIQAVVQKTIKDSMCCPMEPLAGHMAGLIIDMGDGDGDRGLRVFRENFKWLSEVRHKTDRYGSSVFLAAIGLVTVTLLGGMLALVGNWIRGG